MTTDLQTDSLVVGGGIGGLAASLALAQRGWAVHVIERAHEFGEIGAGLQLGPNAMRCLDRLGILKDVTEDAVFPRQLLMMDALSGNPITAVETGEAFRARYGYRYGVMHRSDLHGHLLRACSAHPAITMETNRMAVDVIDEGESARVICKDGSVYHAGLLVGADGLHSRVRHLFEPAQPPICQEYVAFRGTIKTADVTQAAGIDSMVGWVGPQMHLIQYPIRRGDLFNQVAVFRSPGFRPDTEDWGTAEELIAKFSTLHPLVANALGGIGKDRRWTMYDRPPLDKFVRGHIALVGDAAHPMLQYLAQGACQALEDSVCLAEMLSRYDRLEDGLAAFQKARLAHTTRIQLTARFFGQIAHADGVAALFRNRILAQRDPTDYRHFDWMYGSDPFTPNEAEDSRLVDWLSLFEATGSATLPYPG